MCEFVWLAALPPAAFGSNASYRVGESSLCSGFFWCVCRGGGDSARRLKGGGGSTSSLGATSLCPPLLFFVSLLVTRKEETLHCTIPHPPTDRGRPSARAHKNSPFFKRGGGDLQSDAKEASPLLAARLEPRRRRDQIMLTQSPHTREGFADQSAAERGE